MSPVSEAKPTSPQELPAASLQELAAAERSGSAVLLWRDLVDDEPHVRSLADWDQCTLGRSAANQIVVDNDSEVSRVHARLQLLAGSWTLIDDGISRNGTYVNGRRLHGRTRLRDGDTVRVGRTCLHFRDSAGEPTTLTAAGSEQIAAERLSSTQRQILQALCLPYRDGARFAAPASNQQIAEQVHLGVSSVKAQLRRLFVIFAVGELPHNRKRARLAELAIAAGLVGGGPEVPAKLVGGGSGIRTGLAGGETNIPAGPARGGTPNRRQL